MRTAHPDTPALVGIGCRLPGGHAPDARGPAAAWRSLLAGESAITRYPTPRWTAMQERLHPADRGGDPWPVAHLDLPESIDAGAFGIRRSEAALYSPTQILVLEVVAEALADAGICASTLAGPGTGIWVGNASPDEALTTFADGARPRLAELAAGGAGMYATPVSRWLNSRGPLITLDTSCSSSLAALDAAHSALVQKQVETAIVIGVNTAANPVVYRAFGDGPVLADDGRCQPFDKAAHGYVRGEAVVAVVLRRYQRAQADQDRIYALIEHTTVGSDGRSAGVGMPSRDAQAELLARAYAEAGVHPDAVAAVLAHGTGTAAGDRVEIEALSETFGLARRGTRPAPLPVVSVKGLWGHGEGAAGLTGVIAAALSIHHGQLPPTVGHTTLPERFTELGVRVPTKVEDWPERDLPAPRLIGVSSFGFSGALGHTIVRQVPGARRHEPPATPAGPVVLALAAPTGASLAATASVLAPALEGADRALLGRAAAHLAWRRDHFGERAAVVATEAGEAVAAMEALAAHRPHPALVGPHTRTRRGHRNHPPQQLWTFGGHGAAHPGMGADLYRGDAVFAGYLGEALEALEAHQGGPGWHPLQRPALDDLVTVQRATWAVQVALARTLMACYDLVPDVVIGHSLGEVAAAHIAGALFLDDAARLVCARSAVLGATMQDGGMVTAYLPAAEAEEVAAACGVEVAARNAPSRIVFSGRLIALEDLEATLEVRGARPRRLVGAPPAHSAAVEPHLDELAVGLRGLYPRPLTAGIDLISTVTGTSVAGADLGVDYWVRQLREPVQYETALVTAALRRPTLALDLSPSPVLVVPTAETRARHALDLDVVAAGDPDQPARALAAAAAHTWTRHHTLDWPYEPAPPLDVAPTPWQAEAPPVAWGQRLAALPAAERGPELVAIVHRAVADLAPVTVTSADHDRDLAELGLNSMDRLSLRTLLLSGLADPPRDLPEHDPTITSIAAALADLVDRGPSPT